MVRYKVKTREYQLIVKAKLSHKETVDQRQLDFLAAKYIRGLLKARLSGKKTIVYVGPIGVSLYDRLKRPINKYDFFFVMEQIVDIVQKVNINGLIVGNLMFDIKHIFINEITKEMQFIYLPLEQVQPEVNMLDFMESIVYASVPADEQDTEYVSRFIYFIKGLGAFDAAGIENFILREAPNVVNTIKRHNIGQSGFMTDRPADYYAHYERRNAEVADKAGEVTTLLYDDATTMLESDATTLLDSEATTLLYDDATGLLTEEPDTAHYASLYSRRTNEMISINKSVFRIGKEENCSNYVVRGNDKVSRDHADIITRKNRYYITDLNSRNGTFVNGTAIPVRQETEIFDGDRVTLANEEFDFHI